MCNPLSKPATIILHQIPLHNKSGHVTRIRTQNVSGTLPHSIKISGSTTSPCSLNETTTTKK